MVITWLLERNHSTVFGSNNLLLNTIVDGLIAMISDLSSVLHTVWTDATDSSWINAIGISEVIQ